MSASGRPIRPSRARGAPCAAAAVEGAGGSYNFRHFAVDHCPADIGLPTARWRGNADSYTAFFTECFIDELAVLKRVIVQNVAPTGAAVLNAADPIVAKMAPKCKGEVIFFAADITHPVMATHRAQGQAVVYVEGGHIVASKGDKLETIALSEVPITLNGAIGFQVENAMAAIAAG